MSHLPECVQGSRTVSCSYKHLPVPHTKVDRTPKPVNVCKMLMSQNTRKRKQKHTESQKAATNKTSSAKTVHVYTVHNCNTQYNTEQFWQSFYLSTKQSLPLRCCPLGARKIPSRNQPAWNNSKKSTTAPKNSILQYSKYSRIPSRNQPAWNNSKKSTTAPKNSILNTQNTQVSPTSSMPHPPHPPL